MTAGSQSREVRTQTAAGWAASTASSPAALERPYGVMAAEGASSA